MFTNFSVPEVVVITNNIFRIQRPQDDLGRAIASRRYLFFQEVSIFINDY